MKTKAIAKLCKKDGFIRIVSGGSGTWIGDRSSLYYISDIGNLTTAELFTLWDMPPKQTDEMLINRLDELPGKYCFADDVSDEVYCTIMRTTVSVSGVDLVPIKSPGGVRFIRADYFAPISDVDESIAVCERKTADGELYYAIKKGMFITAVVMPYKIGDDAAELLREVGRV